MKLQIAKGGVTINTIFANVRAVANLNLRYFLWQFFQGALPFPHGSVCFHCGLPLSHQHIFFDCSQAQAGWGQCNRALDLLNNRVHYKCRPQLRINPIITDHSIWCLWSEWKPAYFNIRETIAVSMYVIWHTRSLPEKYTRKHKPTIPDMLQDTVQDSFSLTRMIKDKRKRQERQRELEVGWKTASPAWHLQERALELSAPARMLLSKRPDRPQVTRFLLMLAKRRMDGLTSWSKTSAFGSADTPPLPSLSPLSHPSTSTFC
jgi:hypothetical protein